ncbi:hypothetical protein C5167_004487 [Papaver somniferum]|uniref:phosphopyruvate hydratase n=1 Tax=Papaver somniferum TaxID=3469 RepID=A0A4Y7JBR7_PAPSO|nr:hypothetical protein C5167_004487 [Papaver somniferum]
MLFGFIDFRSMSISITSTISPIKIHITGLAGNIQLDLNEDKNNRSSKISGKKLKGLDKVQVVRDDLFVTNPKVNQIGSVIEEMEVGRMSEKAGWGVLTSHHSGETTTLLLLIFYGLNDELMERV